MASIGKFGRRYAKVDLTFEFLDEEFRANPSASKVALVEFMSSAAEVAINDEVKGAKLIMQLLHEVVHPDDFDRFWALAKAERQDPVQDLMPLCQAVLEAVTGFPTGPSGGSSAGPTPTPQRFEVDLPSEPVPAPSIPSGATAADKALAMLRGRPDLQEFVVKQEESERTRNGSALTRA